MKYGDIKRLVKQAAADHLYSLEIYDEFDDGDEGKVDKAIEEIQWELRGKTYWQSLESKKER